MSNARRVCNHCMNKDFHNSFKSTEGNQSNLTLLPSIKCEEFYTYTVHAVHCTCTCTCTHCIHTYHIVHDVKVNV